MGFVLAWLMTTSNGNKQVLEMKNRLTLLTTSIFCSFCRGSLPLIFIGSASEHNQLFNVCSCSMYTSIQLGRFHCIQSDIFVVVKNDDVSYVAKALKVDDDENKIRLRSVSVG